MAVWIRLIVMILCASCVSTLKQQLQQQQQATLLSPSSSSSATKCKIRCGILEEWRGSVSLMSLATEINDNLRRSEVAPGIEVQLLDIKTSSNVSMDALLQAYIGIGSLNVSALLGSYSLSVELIAHKFNIPFFITSSFYAKHQHHLQKAAHNSMTSSQNVLAVFPSPEQLYHVTTDLIRKLKWTSVAVLYDDVMQGVFLVEDLVREPSLFVRAWKCSVDMDNETMREALIHIKNMNIPNVVVMVTRQLNNRILAKALRLSMLSHEYSWILPLLDQDEDLIEAYGHTGVNLYTMRLGHRSHHRHAPGSQHGEGDTVSYADHLAGRRPMVPAWTKFERATIEDSLMTVYHVTRLQYRTTLKCNSWANIEEMISLLSSVDAEGETGRLRYDQSGRRHGYTVTIFRLKKNGFSQFGTWNSSMKERDSRLHIDDDVTDVKKKAESGGTVDLNDVFKIAAVLEPPFFMQKKNYQALEGNDQFQGFLVDLMKLIGHKLRPSGLRYELYLTPDNRYGKPAGDGKWNGLVQQLLEGKAHIALGPFAETSERHNVIDFTQPITRLRLSAVGPHRDSRKLPSAAGGSPFRFFQPLTLTSWLLLMTILPVSGLVLFFIERFHHKSSTLAQTGPEESHHHDPDQNKKRSEAGSESFRPDCYQTFCLSLSNIVSIRTSSGGFTGVDSNNTSPPGHEEPEGMKRTHGSMTTMSALIDDSNMATSSVNNSKRYQATVTLTPIPQTTAGRLLVSAIWLFCAAMLAGYSANLAAILISEELRPAQITFEEMYRRRGSAPKSWESIKYGTVKESDVEDYFKRSDLFSRIGTSMSRPEGAQSDVISTPRQTVTSDMVGNVEEGLERVRSGESPNYVFLWHLPEVRHNLWGDCDLAVAESIGEYISLSIGIPKGVQLNLGDSEKSRGFNSDWRSREDSEVKKEENKVSLRDQINKILVELADKDEILKLEQKWWGKEGCTERFPDHRDAKEGLGFGLQDLAGLMTLFSVAILLSVLVGLIEYRVRVQRLDTGARNRRIHDKAGGLCDGGRATPTTQQLIPQEPSFTHIRGLRHSITRSRGGSTIGPGGGCDPSTESAYSAPRGSSPEPYLLSRTSSEHPCTPVHHSRMDQLLGSQMLSSRNADDDYHNAMRSGRFSDLEGHDPGRSGRFSDLEGPGHDSGRSGRFSDLEGGHDPGRSGRYNDLEGSHDPVRPGRFGDLEGGHAGLVMDCEDDRCTERSAEGFGRAGGGTRYWGQGDRLGDEGRGGVVPPRKTERTSLAGSSPRPSDPFSDLTRDSDMPGHDGHHSSSKLAAQRVGSSLSVAKQTHIF